MRPWGTPGLTTQCGCPPGHHLAVLGAHMSIGSNGVTEAGTVPNRLTGAGVIDTNIQERLRVHLQGRTRMTQVCDQTKTLQLLVWMEMFWWSEYGKRGSRVGGEM